MSFRVLLTRLFFASFPFLFLILALQNCIEISVWWWKSRLQTKRYFYFLMWTVNFLACRIVPKISNCTQFALLLLKKFVKEREQRSVTSHRAALSRLSLSVFLSVCLSVCVFLSLSLSLSNRKKKYGEQTCIRSSSSARNRIWKEKFVCIYLCFMIRK